ncbi:hypothetical protein ACVR1I_08630 [Streptococcus cameli]
MKLTEDFIVLRDRQRGHFLQKIETRDEYLRLNCTFVDDIRFAKVIPYTAYLQNKADVKMLAKMSEAEIVRVQADYTLTYPNGAYAPEITPTCPKGPEIVDILASIMKRG